MVARLLSPDVRTLTVTDGNNLYDGAVEVHRSKKNLFAEQAEFDSLHTELHIPTTEIARGLGKLATREEYDLAA